MHVMAEMYVDIGVTGPNLYTSLRSVPIPSSESSVTEATRNFLVYRRQGEPDL
jgi:hypothetical protein